MEAVFATLSAVRLSKAQFDVALRTGVGFRPPAHEDPDAPTLFESLFEAVDDDGHGFVCFDEWNVRSSYQPRRAVRGRTKRAVHFHVGSRSHSPASPLALRCAPPRLTACNLYAISLRAHRTGCTGGRGHASAPSR